MRRNALLWGSAPLFLLAALHAVSVRREVYALAREIGVCEQSLCETARQRDNLELLRARLGSPAILRRRAQACDIVSDVRRSRAR